MRYRHADVVLIRATTDPGGSGVPGDIDLFSDAVAEQGHAWVARVWRRSEVRDAVQVASPVLSRQIDQMLAGTPDVRRIRRIVVSLASYLLRWQGRATPFGLFAGVAAVGVSAELAVRWGQGNRVTARADTAWVAALVGRLEAHPALLERLSVVVNNAAFVRGAWLVIPGQPSDDNPSQVAPLEISVRYTGPVQAALDASRQPLKFGELVTWLSADYPAVSTGQIRAMLAELIVRHVLLTNLRAPMTTPDALAHVTAQLRAVGADELPGLTETLTQLRGTRDDLARIGSAAGPAAEPVPMVWVADRMSAVCDVTDQPLNVDVSLDCDITVSEAVIGEAEAAARVLLRLTPHPFGYLHWKDFHGQFRNRYGTGAVVPLGDLVADTGLGLPAGFLGSAYVRGARTMTARDDALLALVQQAVMDGREEIVLTEPVIASLTVGDPTAALPPPRVELAFQIHAPSLEAVAAGTFRLVVTGTPRPGSSMAGRFADLLPEADRDRLAETYRAASSAEVAQLSFPARRRHSDNVARVPQLLSRVISVSEHRDAGAGLIALHDLAVTADARRLYLVQLSTGWRIEPWILHALEAGTLTPPLARFLGEVTTARCAVYAGFDWGAAGRLPYLPRMRHGRIVLAPTRWLLNADDLPARGAAWPDWQTALDAWRHRLRVPSAVVLCEGELRLPLTLDHHLPRALLRARLNRARQVALQEAPAAVDLAWIGRAHEFLVPLRLADPQATDPESAGPEPAVVPRLRTVTRDASHLPGVSSVLQAQIYGHPARQDEILTDHLPHLFDGWDEAPLWWFSRHRDMTCPEAEQHLDLYLRLPAPEEYGASAARVGQWIVGLRGRGLVPLLRLSTFHPETGRFGHGAAMAAAEEVFATDATAALAQLTMAGHTGVPPQALTVASLLDLATSFASTPRCGLRWLIDHLPQEHGRLKPSLRDAALEVADPREQWAVLRALPGGEIVVAAWERRRAALATYHVRLAEQKDPFSALRSLLHLHHVRSLGVDPDRERVSNRLSRAAALRQIAHDGGTTR